MSSSERFIDEKAIRAREALATARRNLIGHIPRNVRAAAAIAEARATVCRLDPQQQLLEAAAEARQRRVDRALDAARATLQRIGPVPAPSREVVYKTTEDARVAPTWPISPTPRRQTEALPPSADGIDALRNRFNVLREAIPEVVAHLRDEFQRADDCLHRELNVLRREFDLAHRATSA